MARHIFFNTLNYKKLHTWLHTLESVDIDKYIVCTFKFKNVYFMNL